MEDVPTQANTVHVTHNTLHTRLDTTGSVPARLTVNRVVWRLTWAIADHSEDHTPHPADQGLHRRGFLGLRACFCAFLTNSLQRLPDSGNMTP